ncbi:MAG: CBS domain-containing protein [Actinomycetota bacterium]
MKVSALVGGYTQTIESSASLAEAAQTMVSNGVGSLVVTSNGNMRGIFTEHDLTRAVAHRSDIEGDTVDDWMSDYPLLAAPDWTLEEAADTMVEHGIRHLPILDESGKPTGMISIKDLLWAMRGPSVEE